MNDIRKKKSIIIIVGTTASGKSDIAVRIAKKYNGEIISADSRQIYRHLTIGTAKVNGAWKKNFFLYKKIPHFCIDTVSPTRHYTAALFKKDAQHAIKIITEKNKIPLVVGGTGFWIDTLIYDMNFSSVLPSPSLRKKLEKKSAEELFIILKKIDSRRAKHIEQKNPRRLIRAIEIAKTPGYVPPITKKHPYRTLWIGISRTDTALHHAVTLRARKMIKDGLISETKKLLAMKISKKRIQEFGFEYIAALHVIEKKRMPRELVTMLTRDTIAYAKRQMRWFSRNKQIQWVHTIQEAEQLIKKFLT